MPGRRGPESDPDDGRRFWERKRTVSLESMQQTRNHTTNSRPQHDSDPEAATDGFPPPVNIERMKLEQNKNNDNNHTTGGRRHYFQRNIDPYPQQDKQREKCRPQPHQHEERLHRPTPYYHQHQHQQQDSVKSQERARRNQRISNGAQAAYPQNRTTRTQYTYDDREGTAKNPTGRRHLVEARLRRRGKGLEDKDDVDVDDDDYNHRVVSTAAAYQNEPTPYEAGETEVMPQVLPGAVRVYQSDSACSRELRELQGGSYVEYDNDEQPQQQIQQDDDDEAPPSEHEQKQRHDQYHFERYLQEGKELDSDVQDKPVTKNRRRFITIIIVSVLIVAGVGVGLGVGLGGGSDDSGGPASTPAPVPTPAPTVFIDLALLEYFRVLLVNEGVTDQQMLDEQTTPQHMALVWLVAYDELIPRTTTLTATETQKMITRYALATLFYATNGTEAWYFSNNWLNGTADECDWQFVSCSVNGTVTSLNTGDGGNNLVGALPSELRELQSLERLQLLGNSLTGIHPDIGRLSNLLRLDLNGNDIAGNFPTFVYSLTKLSYLYLNNNNLGGTVTSDISKLTGLRLLDLTGNSLEGNLEHALTGLTNLQFLFLRNNRFTGEIGYVLQNLGASLVNAVLHNNQFSGNLTYLPLLPTLVELVISSNDLTGTIPVALATPRIENLDLGRTGLTGTIPSELGLLPLKLLYLESSRLTGAVPRELCEHLSLQDIRVSCTRVDCFCDSCRCA